MRNKNGLDELGFTEWERKISDVVLEAISSLDKLSKPEPREFNDEIYKCYIALSDLNSAVNNAARNRVSKRNIRIW